MSKRKFHTGIVTQAPTCCLIEDYRTLELAVKRQDWELVGTVMDCISEAIDRYTTVPDGLEIVPSASSMINMSEAEGIVLDDGKDPLCAADIPISDAVIGGIVQCEENCPYKKQGCCPDTMYFMMKDGSVYHNDNLC